GVIDGCQHLAVDFGPGAATVDSHRYVGPQGQANGGEVGEVEAESPEVIETEQGGGGIGAATAEAAPRGQALDEADIGAEPAARRFPEGQGGADDQVVLLGNPGERVAQAHGAVVTGREAELIAVIQQLEEGLQIVVAVGAAPGDMQEQIELGGGRQGDQGASSIGCQALITRVKATSPRVPLMRPGSTCPPTGWKRSNCSCQPACSRRSSWPVALRLTWVARGSGAGTPFTQAVICVTGNSQPNSHSVSSLAEGARISSRPCWRSTASWLSPLMRVAPAPK